MGQDSISNEKNPEKWVEEDCPKAYGYGIRHVQMACMTMCVTTLIIARSCMGVAILAMTDTSRLNDTSITIYNWDKEKQGVILSSFFWGYVLMQIPAGILAKKYGGKPILFAALIANGLLCLLIPVFASLGGWLLVCLARLAMGLTQACTYSSCHTLLGRWLPPRERSSLSGIVYGGTQLGSIIAMPLSGVLAETALGWNLIFYSMSGLLFATAALWYAFAASSPGEHRLMSHKEKEYIESGFVLNTLPRKSIRIPWLHILRSVPMWATLAAHISYAMSFVLFFVDMPTYLEKALRISLKSSASLSALPYVGMWVGSILASTIGEKMCNRGLLSVGANRKLFNSIGQGGVTAGLIVLSFLGPENKTLAIGTLIATLTLSGVFIAGFLLNHLDLSPNFAGVLFSLSNFIANISCVAIPIFTGFILKSDPSDVSRWRIVFLFIAAVGTFTNIIYVIFGTGERQYWDDPDFDDKAKADTEEIKPVMNKEKEEGERDEMVVDRLSRS